MKQGEIWTASMGGKGYAGKPRPVIIIQNNHIEEFESIVLCLITSTNADKDASLRIPITPDENNGLKKESYVMIEKVMAIPKSALGTMIGYVSDQVLTDIKAGLAALLDIMTPES